MEETAWRTIVQEGTPSHWRLTGADGPEGGHGMNIRLWVQDGGLTGVIVTRASGLEIPLLDLEFEDGRLSFRGQHYTDQNFKTLVPDRYATVLTLVARDKFEGHRRKSKTETMGPKLRLVRQLP